MMMCQFLASINWLEAAQALGVLIAAIVAIAALNTWKYQAKAKLKTEFLNELTDSVHEYIQALVPVVETLKIIRIGIDSHKGVPSSKDYGSYTYVISYIERRGKVDSENLWQKLNKIEPLAARVNSLVARGQVYGFRDFAKCANSARMLLWQYHRLQVVAAVIGNTSLNWEHPDAIKAVEDTCSVDPSDIESHLKKYNAEYINFVNENFSQMYAGT